MVEKSATSLTLESLRDLWSKEFLPNIRMEIRTEFESPKASIRDLNRRFDELDKAQTFISKQYDTVLSTVKDIKEYNENMKSQIQQTEENINNLGKDDYNLLVKLDELEQYARRDCLEITGIPIVPNDNPVILIQEASKIIGVDLEASDISIAHRLPPSKKVKDRTIVKFTRRVKRDEIYNKRKHLKSKRTKDLPSVSCEIESDAVSHKAQIHINESLTPYRRRLFGRLLQFKRNQGYKFLWTTNGKILLKKSETSTTNSFTTHEEFDQFLDGQCNQGYKFLWTTNGKILLKKSETSTTNSFTTHEEFNQFLDGQWN